jgi:hypothetical protein
MKRPGWAWILSVLFHPLWVPWLIFFVVLHFYASSFFLWSKQLPAWLLKLSAICWLLLPAVLLFIFKQAGIITTWEMEQARERRLPLLCLLAVYIFSAWAMHLWELDVRLQALPAGVALSLLLAFLLNEFSKISLHTLALGGATTFFAVLAYHTQHTAWLLPLIASIWASGWVYAARLELGAHTHLQLMGGYGTGMVAMWAMYCYTACGL